MRARDVAIPESGYRIEQASDGQILFLAAPLSAELLSELNAHAIAEIWATWRDEVGDLAQLHRFSSLRSLFITNRTLSRLDALTALGDLEELSVESQRPFTIDLVHWPKLRYLCFLWNSEFRNLSCAPNLAHLRVFSWKETDLRKLLDAPQLEALDILGGRLLSLRGIETCDELNALQLVRLTKVADFAGLATLRELTSLRIDTCKKFASLDVLAGLENLEDLDISNLGAVASLDPIRKFRKLTKITFAESTNILDGNTGVVAEMGLKYAFMNRKHYNLVYDHITGAETKR
jgi:Leucine-rich repeat (LRR) protein